MGGNAGHHIDRQQVPFESGKGRETKAVMTTINAAG